MGRVAFLLALAICGSIAAFASDPAENWLPITQADLQLKEVRDAPGAPAVLLYYADSITYVSEYDQTEFIYRRIKILTDAGKRYADVEIPLLPWVKIRDLEARAIGPDGIAHDITAAQYDKVIIKGRGFQYLAKTFTFPGVTTGTIIEYKYRLHSSWIYANEWTLQHSLYVLDETFSFKHTGHFPMSFLVSGSEAAPEEDKDTYRLELKNVPPFTPELQMPPEDNYRGSVRFFYSTPGLAGSTFWVQRGLEWSRSINSFIGSHRNVAHAATAAIGDATDPREKLRRLYARAQQVRNLSYERELTRAEEKKEKIKENNNVADVLKHGYGTAFDISALFVAMARASGFDASFVLVASRGSRFFQRNYLNAAQYDDSMAAVTLNGKTMFLDPGTRFCPFGLIRWTHSATEGLEIDKKKWVYLTLPSISRNGAEVFRNARGAITEDGTLKAEVSLTFRGVEALERRLLAIQMDQAGRDKMMENQLRGWLPPQSTATVTGTTGWDQEDAPLVVTFSIKVPAYASVAGNLLVLPANLFPTNQKATFQRAHRKYPVYFSYAFSEFDLTVIEMPKGYSVENLPAPVEDKAPFGEYRTVLKRADNQIIATRGLMLDNFLFAPEKYKELKQFFDTVGNGDTAQLVIRKTGGRTQTSGSAPH